MSEKFGGEILQKYADIERLGRKELDHGNISEFKGFSETLRNRFSVSILPNISSELVFRHVLLSEIEKIEKECGISLSLAGRDFPAHITVLEGELDVVNMESEQEIRKERENIFSNLQNDESLKKIIESLKNKEIRFNYLLIDKGNLLLTSSDIPEFILNARERISNIYNEKKLNALPIKNILHLSIGRITELPKDANKEEKLREYKQKIIKLRHSISENPISIKIGEVGMKNSYDFLTSGNQKQYEI